MPELPDITVYVERIAVKTQGAVLRELKLHDAFVLRTAVPPVASLQGLRVVDVRRLGKRVVLGFADGGQATPRLISGIGNAYSDEILHRARLSPLALTRALDTDEWQRLYDATRAVLVEWTERLRAAAGDFPKEVTAFHPAMAVHGRYGQPCPVC